MSKPPRLWRIDFQNSKNQLTISFCCVQHSIPTLTQTAFNLIVTYSDLAESKVLSLEAVAMDVVDGGGIKKVALKKVESMYVALLERALLTSRGVVI